ncbi:hypothetical protein EVAR_2331_1 [Eumeta japonica]|uniref:Uncharacterized protein n=1 Tax=Eumeta variegata TaxID=151549 RepID=A0A4C1SI63_EUMVA|nr:hypothetical protein EVAR_2331_1 [Eumeta japonica]
MYCVGRGTHTCWGYFKNIPAEGKYRNVFWYRTSRPARPGLVPAGVAVSVRGRNERSMSVCVYRGNDILPVT